MSGKAKGLSCKEDVLSSQELTMLLLVCSSVRDKFMVYALVLGGLRVSELKHLRRSWVNLEEGTIAIPTRQHCKCAECNCIDPKGKRGCVP